MQLAAAILSLAACSAQPLRHPVSGRLIAPVMGAAGAAWLERVEREPEERPRLAVRLLRIGPGQTVVDIGAGSGYYTELLARAVGPSGRVYATDIQPEMIRLLEQRTREKRLANVQAVLSTETDPRLPPASLDLALLVDVYHEFAYPQQMLRRLREALKPSGRLVLIEFRKEDPSVPIREEHKMSIAEARAEVEPEGFVFDRVLNDLPWQHILIFRK
ncbi:MAG: class I SAM-dependent methyltransferase [Bryobacteraceae bacterium]